MKDVFTSPWHEFSKTVQLIVAYYVPMRHFHCPLSTERKKGKWRSLLWKPRSERWARRQFESLGSSTEIVLHGLMQQVTCRCCELTAVDKYLAESGGPAPGAANVHQKAKRVWVQKKRNALFVRLPSCCLWSLNFFFTFDEFICFWREKVLIIESSVAITLLFGFSAAVSFSCSVMIKSFTRHYITCFSASIVGLISRLYE